MKIKSNLQFNTSLLARHLSKGKEDKVVIGGSLPEYMVIPAGASIELEDSKWVKFAKAAEAMLDSGKLTMVDAPSMTEEERVKFEEDELAKAKATVAKLEPAKVQPRVAPKPA
tara:strand:- start:5114 stop:5452 length:339 start_codon:yes stop_codon:yes gene_type:complete